MFGIGVNLSLICTIASNWGDEDVRSPQQVIRELRSLNVKVRRSAGMSLLELSISNDHASKTRIYRAMSDNLDELVSTVANKREDAEVRTLIIRAMATVSERRRFDQKFKPLIEVLSDEADDEDVRSWIAMVLPELVSSKQAGPALLKATKNKSQKVRGNAAGQLGRVNLTSATLLTWAKEAINDRHHGMRASAITMAAQQVSQDERAIPIVVRGISDSDSMNRFLSVSLVLAFGLERNKKFKTALVSSLRDLEASSGKMTAAVALLKEPTNRNEAIAVLKKGLTAKDVGTREGAAIALTWCAAEARVLVPALRKAFGDPSDRVRVHAAVCLARIQGETDECLRLLKVIESSEDEYARFWARSYRANFEIVVSGQRSTPKKKNR